MGSTGPWLDHSGRCEGPSAVPEGWPGGAELWFFSGHMALGQRIHVQEAGKGDKRWYTQKPDMQGGHEHKDLGTGKGGGLWDSTRTLTPGWEVRDSCRHPPLLPGHRSGQSGSNFGIYFK